MYKYIYCGIPTGSCRRNRYICQQGSAYGADIFTPHLPQAASSPQATQGEDNRVRRKTQQRTDVWRGTRGFLRSPEPGNRKTQQRTTGLRSSYGFHQCPEPGNRNNRIRRCSNSLKKSRINYKISRKIFDVWYTWAAPPWWSGLFLPFPAIPGREKSPAAKTRPRPSRSRCSDFQAATYSSNTAPADLHPRIRRG